MCPTPPMIDIPPLIVFVIFSLTLVGESSSLSSPSPAFTGRHNRPRRVRRSPECTLHNRANPIHRTTAAMAIISRHTNECGTTMAMADSETARASSAVSEPTNSITISNSNMNIDKDHYHHHHNNSSSSSSSSNNNIIPVGSRRERKRSKKNAALLRRTIRIENRHAILGEGKQHKWLGGAVDAQTGKIYGIPSHANEIICIESPPPLSSSTTSPLQSSWVVEQCSSSTTTTTTTTARISTIPLPSTAYRHGPFKWLRGIVYNDCLYGIPSWHTGGVLKVNLRNVDNVAAAAAAAAADEDGKTTLRREVVSILPLPHESSYYEDCGVDSIMDDQVLQNYRENNNTKEDNADDDDIVNRARWMWHGGAIGNGGDGASSFSSSSSPPPPPAIYCPPSNAEHVLKVYLDGTDRVEEIGPKFVKGQNKWYGGILGVDGCIYAPPYTATGVLRIDPRTDNVQVIGHFPYGGYKWHGGLLAKSTGVIYAFPAHSNEVLCIDTNVDRRRRRRHSLDEKKHDDNNNEKDDGIGEGRVVDEESESSSSWRVSTIPIHRHEKDTDSPDLRYKWLGGSYGADGCIYGMPSDATTILRIDPIKNEATTFGNVPGIINKWQGGVLSSIDKCFYAVPANMDCILRVNTDPTAPPSSYLHIDYLDIPSDGSGTSQKNIDDKWQGGFVGRDGKIYAIPENFNYVMVVTPGDNPIVEIMR